MSKVFNMVGGGGGGPYASIFVTGLNETDTVTAVHKKTVQVPNPDYIGLPDGYTQLEYIESTGTQYIDTGLVATPNTGFFLDFNMNSPFTSGDYQGIFGSYGTANYGTFSVSNYTKRFSGGQFSYGDGRYDAKIAIGKRMQLEFKNYKYVSSVGASFSVSPDAKVADTPSLYLFAHHDTSVSGNIYGLCSALIYSAKFYEGENVVMDLVPTRRNSDSVIGLYDLVTSTFFENAGTGTFTAGSEIPTYIETTVEDKTLNGKWTTKLVKNYDMAIIPKMTSDTEPSGTATVSKVDSADAGYAYKAFDQDSVTYAYGGNGSIPWTLQYEFPGIVLAKTISFKVAQPSSDGSRTATFNVQVLSDDIWQTVYSGTTTKSIGSSETQTVALEEPKNITAVKIVNTAMTGNGTPSICVMDFQVYADVETSIGGFEIKPIRDFGTWAVTATDGVHTKTQDVLVDVITEYEIEMSYKLWLYKDGDGCEDVTGGWSSSGYTTSSTLHEPTKNNNSVTLYCNTDNYASFIGTVNPISFKGYSKLKCCTKNVSINGTYAGGTIHFDAQKTAQASSGQYVSFVRSSDESECEINITDFQGVYYVCAQVFNATSKADLTKVWLE